MRAPSDSSVVNKWLHLKSVDPEGVESESAISLVSPRHAQLRIFVGLNGLDGRGQLFTLLPHAGRHPVPLRGRGTAQQPAACAPAWLSRRKFGWSILLLVVGWSVVYESVVSVHRACLHAEYHFTASSLWLH